MRTRRPSRKAIDPCQGSLLDGRPQPERGEEVGHGKAEYAPTGAAHPLRHADNRPWAPRGMADRRIPDEEWWDMHRRALNMTPEEKLEQLRRDLASCLKCRRVVAVLIVRRGEETLVADSLPRDRQVIAELLGPVPFEFGRRTPMLSLLGERIREAHDCNAPAVVPDPEMGWKPGKHHNADIYDMG